MIKIKQLAIFMDDASAYLMELYNHMIVSRNIVFKSKDNEEFIQYNYSVPSDGSENPHHQLAYYNELGDIIKNYQEVVIFGPAKTKDNLYEMLETKHQYKDIKIKIINTDKMSDIQIHKFVLDYYKEAN